MAHKVYVDSKLKEKKVIVFAKSGCPYCTMAKEVFDELIEKGNLSKENFEQVDIGKEGNMSAIQDYLKYLTGARTVPRVFINGKCIGGGSEVKAMYSSGELAKQVKALDAAVDHAL